MNIQQNKLFAYKNRSLSSIKGEKWKPIDGYEDYYLISNFGRVKSFARHIEFSIPGRHMVSYWMPEKILSQGVRKRWNSIAKEYISRVAVTLCVEQKMKTISICRLVWNAFVEKINFADDGILIAHKDGNSLNNHYKNLVSGDSSFIGKLAYSRGRFIHLADYLNEEVFARSGASRSKPVTQYDFEGKRVTVYSSITEAEKKTGVMHSNITLAAIGKKLQMGGYIWRFGKGKKTIDISFYQKAKEREREKIMKLSKCVTQYDLSGNRINVYPSISEAARSVNGHRGVISAAVTGRNITAQKSIWRLGRGPQKIGIENRRQSKLARNKGLPQKNSSTNK